VQARSAKKTVFSVGHNTFFTHDGGTTVVRYLTDRGTAELALGTNEQLCEGNAPFESADDQWVDTYLPLLMAIESGINRAHEDDPKLKDKDLVTILERLAMKADIHLESRVAVAIQENLVPPWRKAAGRIALDARSLSRQPRTPRDSLRNAWRQRIASRVLILTAIRGMISRVAIVTMKDIVLTKLVLIPYEETDTKITPVTVHATTRQQIKFRINTGRFKHE
jgi:hypothetical protein